MKKIQLYTIAAAALVMGLASCAPDGDQSVGPVNPEEQTAWVSIKIEKQSTASRASSELAGTESTLKSLYIVTFDQNGTIVKIPDGAYFIPFTGTIPTTVVAQKVSAATKNLLVVANPGAKIYAALGALGQGSTYAVFNEAVKGITGTEIKLADGSFTMISSPVDTGKADGDQLTTALVAVNPAVVGEGATEHATDALAKQYANENPTSVRIERLASKLVFNPVVKASLNIEPAGADFEFTSWTVDAVNSTFYPYAKRTLFSTNHVGTHYSLNFYTEDPNFTDVAPYQQNSGLVYTTVPRTFEGGWAPKLPWNNYYGWMNDVAVGEPSNNVAYMVENTMAAAAQRFGNATRVVIKGKYVPAGFTMDQDWFRFGSKNYQTLELLQAAFTASLPEGTAPDQALVNACNAFLAQVKVANPAITTTDFAELTQTQLDAIASDGGEVAKVPDTGVGIRWYQDSVNYWYYEIRHDAERTATMEFSKYGVVRNNWYNLTLQDVTSQGTPWYPDLINPGDGDPKPEDPIDSKYGFINIVITPANWIVWENGMKI